MSDQVCYYKSICTLQSVIIINFSEINDKVNMMAVLIILLLSLFMNIIWFPWIHTKYKEKIMIIVLTVSYVNNKSHGIWKVYNHYYID